MPDARLIDANALREYIVACQMVNDESFYYSFAEARVFDRVLEDIDAAPTIDPERCGLWRTAFMALCRKLRMESFAVRVVASLV